ncbi:MAG: hypothetical protein WCY77_09970 [Weeksellaceae bacterium]
MNLRRKTIKDIELNPPQAAAVCAVEIEKKNKIFLKMGRGTGKSTIHGYFIKEAVSQMPGSTGLLVGPSYKQLKSVLLKSIKTGLSFFGILQDVHYVVGRQGKGFEKPVDSPDNWHDVLHFHNGTVVQMVSMDLADSGRGFNADWVVGDEAALFDSVRYQVNVAAANRAKKEIYSNSSLLNAEILSSTVPLTKKGRWFSEREAISMKPENKASHAYIKASTHWNLHNLKDTYLKEALETSPSQMHYDAEYGNIDPPAVLNAFYSFFNEDHHTYEKRYNIDYFSKIKEYDSSLHNNCNQDEDLIRGVPITISVDPGSNINSLTVWQYIHTLHEERTLKEFFVTKPHDYDDLLVNFDAYYESHKATNNTVYLRHDAQAHKERDENDKTIAHRMETKLRQLGWRVINVTQRTNNPRHALKYVLINEILKERDQRLPKWRINRHNCPNLIISISNAETEVKSNSEYNKDKSSEQDANILPQHATHLSDTADYYLYWKYAAVLQGSSTDFSMPLR